MTYTRIAFLLLLLINPLRAWGQVRTSDGQPAGKTSGVLREVWTNIDGAKLEDLYSSPNFPDQPLLRVVDRDFRSPVNWGDRYGVRMRAILTPYQSTNYTFWISGDDNCELWLGTDATPESRRRIARVPGWTAAEVWNKFPEQKSEQIRLEAGKGYYIEAIMKEHGGGDSLTVAWSRIPSSPQIINTFFLTPFEDNATTNPSGLILNAGPDVVQFAPNLAIQASAQVMDLDRSWPKPSVLWTQVSGVKASVSDADLFNPEIELPNAGDYTFSATATSASATVDDQLAVKILPPLHPEAGKALTEYWFGVRGGIDEFVGHPDFPDRPHAHRFSTELASRERIGDLYGARTRGFLLVPESGSYRFFVSGDDQVELLLSSDESSGNLQLLASVSEPVAFGDYFASAAQASQPIQLVGGQRYAFEVLHQEEWSNDHFSVAWQMPGTDYASEISMEFLAPPADAATVANATQELNLDLDYTVDAGRDHIVYLPQKSVHLDGYARRRQWGSDFVSERWSQISGPAGVVFAPANDDVSEASFPGVGTYVLEYSVETTRNTTSDTLTVDVRPSIHPDSGFLTREVWWQRSYDSIADFRGDPDFPSHPDIVDSIPGLRQSHNWSSKYGTRVTGILHIPAAETTASYRFYVSGDDAVEFSISTDETPENLRRACYATAATGRERWDKFPTQASYPIELIPGRSYFVELLHKQTWGSDYFAVAWTKGDESVPQNIDGSYFSPRQQALEFNSDMNYYAAAGRDRTYNWPHDTTNLSGELIRAQSTGNLPVYSWRQTGGATAVLENPQDLNSRVVFPSTGDYTFELTVSEGGFTHRDAITMHVQDMQEGVTGFLTRSVWFDVRGREVDDLKEIDPDLKFPHFEDLYPGAETPVNWADNYGTRLSGFVTVPASGNYQFWIASDDYSEIWFDAKNGAGSQRIAFLQLSSGFRNWDRRSTQKSAEINLVAGVAYPITILHKEYSGSDFLSVAMEGPATNGRELLSRGFLSPTHAAVEHNSEITITAGVDRTLLWPQDTLLLAALVYDLADGPQPLSYAWSTEAPGVGFNAPSRPVTEVSFPGPGVYEIIISADDGANSARDSVFVVVENPLVPNAGGLLREAWVGISGWRLSDLIDSTHYGESPDFSDILPSFETPTNWADNYGQRLTGYLQVPAEGDYVLLVASDDQSEVWFNPDGMARADARKVAYANRATSRHRWNRYDTQRSEPFRLVPGKRYFIQALHKEGSGSDYLALAYQRADLPDSEPIVIPGALLSPPDGVSGDAFDGEVGVSAGQDIAATWPTKRFELHGTAIDYVPGPDTLAYRWSVSSAPAGATDGVILDFPTAPSTGVEFPVHGAYELQLTVTDGFATRSDTLRVQLAAPLAGNTGSLLCEVYENISGGWVKDLIASDHFPDAPDNRFQLRRSEIESNQADKYGMLIRGYLHPPVSGIYRFNLASDDWSEVFISPDATPENKEMACFVPAATTYYEWRKFPDYQLSRPIELVAGESYYIEIRYKENGWRDHMALAWLTPGSSEFEIIDGAYLSPWLLADAVAPEVTLSGNEEMILEVGNEFVDPGFAARDLVDGDVSGLVEVSGTVDTGTPGEYLIRYAVKDASGNESTVVTRRVRVVLAAGDAPVYPQDNSRFSSVDTWDPPATISALDASRFLKQATFGPTAEEIASVQGIGFEAWIDAQLALPPTSHLEQIDMVSQYNGARSQLLGLAGEDGMEIMMPGSMMEMPMSRIRTDDRLWTWWTVAATAPDQLRQRVAFALSEIMVISDNTPALRNYPRGVANYSDILSRHAFGNYRELLQDVTLNPMMGIWLTMVRSSKEQADENYPRELLQLFSIGLNHLNFDGTFKRDAAGNTIPTYGQSEILDLSRAFTGWTFAGSQSFTWTGSSSIDEILPMMAFEEHHDREAKTIIGGATLPAGLTAQQDVKGALDVIAQHPNVGPFIALRLIQRLVTSNPSPSYIYRVTSVFNDNGSGVRGDLGAVVKAILLDPEAREAGNIAEAGKLSEPILRFVRLLRALPQRPTSNPPVLGRYLLSNVGSYFGQSPIQANSVFNFFHPDHQEPGPLMDAGLFTPEFEITTEITTVSTANYFFDGADRGFPASVARVRLDLDSLERQWPNPSQLLGDIETLLLGRSMSVAMRTALLQVHSAYAGRPGDGVEAMVQIVAASPEFSVDR